MINLRNLELELKMINLDKLCQNNIGDIGGESLGDGIGNLSLLEYLRFDLWNNKIENLE